MSRFVDFTGKTFGRLKVLGVLKRATHVDKLTYQCECSCGNIVPVLSSSLQTENTKSCGCLRRDMHRLRPFEAAYRQAQRHIAYFSDWTLELTFEEFLVFVQQKVCHYCGDAIQWVEFPVKDQKVGYNLDRKDNSRGYTKDNVVACCKVCNYTKGDRFTYEEFLILAHGLRLVQYLRHPVDKKDLPFMHTFSGKLFRYLKPEPEDICIEDIAHGLSQLNRFVGQTVKPYSVAQHSVLVSKVCPAEFSLYGLLHDASEAYTTDVCRVLKLSPGMGVYKWYENLTMTAICKKFNLAEKEPPEVKKADIRLLLTEKRDLFVKDCAWAVNKDDGTYGVKPLPTTIRPWMTEEAEERFLKHFKKLTKK